MKKIGKFFFKRVMLFFFAFCFVFIYDACALIKPSKNLGLRKFFKVLDIIEQDYVDENIDEKKLLNGAIKGMLEALDDPHTVYLPDEFMQDMNTTSDGKYGGVGMIISEKDDYILVVTPMEDYPAYKKGINAGDLIISVDGNSLKGVSVSDAADMLRGTPDTSVKLEVLRHDITFEVELKRAIIDLPSVKYAWIDDKYGYLRIVQFAGTTDKYVEEALLKFKEKGAKAVIVDLRYNPGGLLSQVIDIVDYFQNEGVIVSTIGRRAFDNTVSNATESRTIVPADVPVVVLIDKGSASASEIFAGAIKDTKRGILIGEKTFGKGSVQTIYRLGASDGFKITVAKYYTPSGECIDGIGIEPNIEVKEPELSDAEKEALKKIYNDKVIDNFVEKNSDPSDQQINEFIDSLRNKGYNLSKRYLKKLVKNAAEFDDNKKTVFDLDFDLQLQKAVEVLDKGLIEFDGKEFKLPESEETPKKEEK